MIHIKLFETFQSDQDIIDICRKYNIQNYTINEDKSIDVDGDVFVSKEKLTKLPLNFNHISGSFYCNFNKLTTLHGSPKSVSSNFYCDNNELTTLQDAPKSVGGSFRCSYNLLTSLQGAPKSVGDDFYCHNNQLTNLQGAPESVGGYFRCSKNELTTFEGAPKSVGGSFLCYENPIYYVWELISPDDEWNYDNIDLLNDYSIFRGEKSIIKARLNSFLEDIDMPTVDEIKYYEFI